MYFVINVMIHGMKHVFLRILIHRAHYAEKLDNLLANKLSNIQRINHSNVAD